MTDKAPTPGPWSLEGKNRPWICTVGNNPDDPAIFGAPPGPDGVYQFGDKGADARYIVQACNGYRAQQAQIIALQDALKPFAAFDDGRAPFHLPITQGSGMARRQLTIGDCRNAKRALEKSYEGQAVEQDTAQPDQSGAADR